MLTSIVEIIEQVKDFEELHNPVEMSSLHKEVPQISGVLESTSVVEVAVVIRNLHCCKTMVPNKVGVV